MFTGGLFDSGAMGALEATIRYSGQRQRILAHNVANATTPNFQPVDVSPQHFQKVLGEAIERRRAGGNVGSLTLESTQQIRVRAGSAASGVDFELTPKDFSGNVLMHDRNNRDLERMMADQAENVMVFKMSVDLLRSRYDVLRSAIAERV